MKFKKLISLLLVAMMVIPSVGAFAASDDEITLFATEDTYTATGSRLENKNYGNDATMLFGSTYNRTAFLKFDLSDVVISDFKGALLELNVKAASSGGSIDIYTVSADWSEKDLTGAKAPQDFEFVVKHFK